MQLTLLGILLFSTYLPVQEIVDKEYEISHNKVAILKSSKNGFGKNVLLSKTDITLLEQIIVKSISDNNVKDNLKNATYLMKLEMYNRQYIPFIKDGYKQVWVNCFCDDIKHFPRWKKEIITIYDGGGCYFSVLINLTKEEYSKLYVNGIG